MTKLQNFTIRQHLDIAYGGSHFWTVDLVNPDTGGSYFQLFHGRLR